MIFLLYVWMIRLAGILGWRASLNVSHPVITFLSCSLSISLSHYCNGPILFIYVLILYYAIIIVLGINLLLYTSA